MENVKHWLDLYASNLYEWRSTDNGQRKLCYRRQGIVENIFDSDGIDFEGRADLNLRMTIDIRSTLDDRGLRDRLILVWAVMRNRHVLLASKSLQARTFLPGSTVDCWPEKCFVYAIPDNKTTAITDAEATSEFLQDSYPGIDGDDFYTHVMNAARMFDAERQLARLFVLPRRKVAGEIFTLEITLVMGHSIVDGLTSFRWTKDFVELMNKPQNELINELDDLCRVQRVSARLPPPQEALYPPLAQSLPLQRWKWVITRMLRHVRKAPPAAFQNPLRRDSVPAEAIEMPHKYPEVLNYARKPPLNAGYLFFNLSRRASANLITLCRQAGISVGSGSFTLVSLVMMRLEEKRHPHILLQDRLPFVGSFPVNPRPFLAGTPTTGKEDSCMLAFSDGVTLPFLSSDLNLEKSFRVLGRLAHRQLNQYQKRKRTPEEVLVLGSRSPSQLLPSLYVSTLERQEGKVPPHRRCGFTPQGKYPASQGGSLATCGISSVGDRTKLISSGICDVAKPNGKDMIADYRSHISPVRPRDGEMLIAPMGTKEYQSIGVSYDATTLDPGRMHEWERLLKSLLDYDMESGPAPVKL